MSKRSGIQLAYPMEERRLTDPKFGWSWPVIVQPKLNGERCRALMTSDGIQLLSSECNRIISVPHINKQIAEIFQYLPPVELDGELYKHGWDFSEIHSVLSRKSIETIHERSEQMEFHIFDLVSDDHQSERLLSLSSSYSKYFPISIKKVPIYIAYDMKELMEIYQNYLDLNYEGIIVRHIGAPYIRSRSRFMLKFKPKKEDYYKIDSITEAISASGQHLSMLGAFNCHGSDGTIFKIGAGKLSHSERRSLWKDRASLRGKFCHVQYQALSLRGAPLFGLCLSIVENNPEEETTGGGGLL